MDDAELKRLADAATPGPWIVPGKPGDGAGAHDVVAPGVATGWPTGVLIGDCGIYTSEDDAAFIAAANPATILRLLRERDELAVEMMDNSISAAAVVIQLRRERDEARAEAARLTAAIGEHLTYEGPCGDSAEMCVLCHDDSCTHCGLAVSLGGKNAECSDDCALDADHGEGDGT